MTDKENVILLCVLRSFIQILQQNEIIYRWIKMHVKTQDLSVQNNDNARFDKGFTSYRKTPKNSDTRKIAAITLKLNNVELL